MTNASFLRVLVLCALACSDNQFPEPQPEPLGVLEPITALNQSGPAGTLANHPPTVRVLRPDGGPFASGIDVRFVASGGSVTPSIVKSGPDGVARVTSWQLASGPSEVRAEVVGRPAVVFSAEGKARSFDLVVRWLEPPTPAALTAVSAAESTLEQIIWDDLPDQVVTSTPVCPIQGVPSATLDESIDDVLILARIGPMDGPGGAGAQGFPCLIRDPGTQTIVGFIRLDQDDFAVLPPGLQREFALHEMVHALGMVPGVLNITTPTGFTRSCIKLPSTGAPNTVVQDSHFACPNAVAAFDVLGGVTYSANKVPLENGATRPLGANTLNHHWRKTSLTTELMTGWFVFGQAAPLSLITVGALEDLGYAVSYQAAEPFTFGSVIATELAAEQVVHLIDAPGAPAPAFLRSAGPARR